VPAAGLTHGRPAPGGWAAQAKQAKPKQARQKRRHKTHPRPTPSHGEALARREIVPLDRNAKVRVMMVARALMPLFAEFLRTFELSTWPRDWRRSTRAACRRERPLLSCNAATEPSDEHERCGYGSSGPLQETD
jgi:hypothetical protein